MSVTLNKNFLSPNGFRLSIHSQQFSNVEYFCINSPLPAISATEINTPFRNRQNAVPGEKVQFTPLDIRYMVTEGMENYIELFNWLVSNAQVEQFQTYDIVLHVLSSSNNVIRQIRFADAFPISLGAIDFHTQNTDVEYVIGDAAFMYSHFEFLK